MDVWMQNENWWLLEICWIAPAKFPFQKSPCSSTGRTGSSSKRSSKSLVASVVASRFQWWNALHILVLAPYVAIYGAHIKILKCEDLQELQPATLLPATMHGAWWIFMVLHRSHSLETSSGSVKRSMLKGHPAWRTLRNAGRSCIAPRINRSHRRRQKRGQEASHALACGVCPRKPSTEKPNLPARSSWLTEASCLCQSLYIKTIILIHSIIINNNCSQFNPVAGKILTCIL